jgi:dihydrofolate reductase
MGKLVYSFHASLDGYINGPDGKFGWAEPDEELHRLANEEAASVATFLFGRGLYEIMTPWETMDGPDQDEVTRDFAGQWKRTPKIVFSRTLEVVGPNARLVRTDAVDEVRRLKRDMDGLLMVGGAVFAGPLIEAGLMDEYWVYQNPILVGGGTPMFPRGGVEVKLKLTESRAFASGVTLARYEAVR